MLKAELREYAEEYKKVIESLVRSGKVIKVGGAMYLYKDELEKLLNLDKYATKFNKLKVWKAFKWIDTNKDGFTRYLYNSSTHEKVACIKVWEAVYKTICSRIIKDDLNVTGIY